MSLRGESRSERKVSRPVWPICASHFLLERKMRWSGMVYLELIKWQKYFLGSLSLAWCNLGPIVLLWDCSLLTESEFEWFTGKDHIYVVLNVVHWVHSALSGWTWNYVAIYCSHWGQVVLLAAILREAGVKQCSCSWVHYLYSDLIHKGHCLDSTCRFLRTPVFGEALGFQLPGSPYLCCFILVQLLRFKVLSNCVLEQSSVPRTFPFKRRGEKIKIPVSQLFLT